MTALADELGELRSKMRALKAREEEIKASLKAGEVNDLVGAEWRIILKEQTSKRIDKNKLPPDILNNPDYYIISTSTVVRVVKIEKEMPVDDDIALFEDDA